MQDFAARIVGMATNSASSLPVVSVSDPAAKITVDKSIFRAYYVSVGNAHNMA